MHDTDPKKELLYAGKTKSLYKTDDDDWLIAEFRDDTTAFDGEKKDSLADKGSVTNQINAHLMQTLQAAGLPTHFQKQLSPTESLVRHLTMLPLEAVVRNRAAGSLCRRLGLEANTVLNPPLYELFLKNDALHDPFINEHHALQFGWATQEQLRTMEKLSLQINTVLTELFDKANLLLVDAKYEFGIAADGLLYLGDEISPDSCRIWDKRTGEPLDKDRFRKDLGQVVSSYQRIAELLGIPVGVRSTA